MGKRRAAGIAAGKAKAAGGKRPRKDYAYRSTWKHKRSRARNLARRGGLTKQKAIAKHGRLPRGKDWWGAEVGGRAEWEAKWIVENPQPNASS